MGDKHDPVAIADPESPPDRVQADLLPAFPLGPHPLERHAPVVRSLRGRNRERRLLRHLAEPVEQRLTPGRGDLPEHPPPAHRDQEEEAPASRADDAYHAVELRQVLHILSCDQGIDLKGDSRGHGVKGGLHRPNETPRDLADAVVDLLSRPVQAERHGFDAQRLEPADDIAREGEGGAGSERQREPEADSVIDQLPEVRPLEGIPSGQDHVGGGTPEAYEGVEKPASFGGGELAGIATRDGLGPAVAAGQVAGPRQFPVDPSRRVGEDVGGAHGAPPARLTRTLPLRTRAFREARSL